MNDFTSLVDSALPHLLSHLWSSTLFLLIVLLVIGAVRRKLTAGAIFSLALIGIIKFVLPSPLLGRVIDRFDFFHDRVTAVALPLRFLGGTFPIAEVAAPSRWPVILTAIWAVVALMLIIRFTIVRRRLITLSLRTATPATPREVEALRRARTKLGIRRSIDIARSAAPEAPAVLRTLRPVIVLPVAGCDELTDAELESLLGHECAHVARYDNLVARLESFICALFWFHPLIWIAQRITVIERERACDEVVAGTADERNTYLTALRKFCHAAIAPRLPGVSCMATARLKERIDHVMNYASLKAAAPAPRSITILATAVLVLFTAASALISGDAFARSASSTETKQYSVKISAKRNGEAITLTGRVSDTKSQEVISEPTITFISGKTASTKTTGGTADVTFNAHSVGENIIVDVSVERDGSLVQHETFAIVPDPEAGKSKYTGEPITLALKDAEIRNVIQTFGQLTGMTIQIADDVQGKVSVNWRNVPWDEAFATMLDENGLTYRVEGSTIHVTRK